MPAIASNPEQVPFIRTDVENWTDGLANPAKAGTSIPTWRELMSACLERIVPISRTMQGISDTSTSPLKEALLQSGEALGLRARRNFMVCMANLLLNDQFPLKDALQAEELILNLHAKLNRGLVDERHGTYRRWETDIPCHVRLDHLPSEIAAFYQEFFERSQSIAADPVAFAAWIEKRFNAELHLLSDACGRTSRLLACVALVRSGLSYPRFETRDDYFACINQSHAAWCEEYRCRI